MQSTQFALPALTFFFAACAPALAQTVLEAVDGEAAGDRFGTSVTFVGEWNLDGHDDWAAGAPEGAGLVAGAGYVKVLSGLDGSQLHRFDGVLAGDRFGQSLAAVDLDGDGLRELIVGASGARRVRVYAGDDQSVMHDVHMPGSAEFGYAVAGLGDVDGDAVPDFAGGAPQAGPGAAGRVFALSGATGAVVQTFQEPFGRFGIRFGHAVCGVDDVNGDGRDDVAIGAPRYAQGFDSGWVSVHSGLDGRVLWSASSFTCAQMGTSVATIPDVNGDGFDEVLSGGDGFGCLACVSPGRALLHSGLNGTVLDSWQGGCDTGLGVAVAHAGDVNADGAPDLLVSEAADSPSSAAFVYSGVTGGTIVQFDGPPGSFGDTTFGSAVAGDGRVDAGPFPDFLIANPSDDSIDANRGRVTVATLGCPVDAAYLYCTASVNSSGNGAQMNFGNSLSIAANDLELICTNGPPSVPGIFFYGSTPIEEPFGDGFRCIGGSIFRLNPPVMTTMFGRATRAIDYASPPTPAGELTAGSTWFFQFWYRDNAAGGTGFNLSNGMRATFCP